MSTRKWFHPNISGPDAAVALKQCGYDGAFLVRRSKSSPNDFTLCCKQQNEVFHIKIQATEEYFDLYGGDKFATLSELIEHYRMKKTELKEKNGTVINLNHPVLSQDPTSERWFHGQLPGKEAERMLKEKGEDGRFLVRASQSQPGNFVLSIRETAAKITHVQIRAIGGGKYDVGGGEQFADLGTLVKHYQDNPMVETNGAVVKMTEPFHATRVSAASIQARVAELSKETDEVFGRAGFYDEFEELQSMDDKVVYDRKEGQRPENKKKNRYKNILPFDHTRVSIAGDGSVGSDYINANYLNGHPEVQMSRKAYIACQGPLKATVASYWQMMWEQDIRLIVMTTEIVERGKNKCHPYWPRTEDPRQPNPDRFGDFLVELVSEQITPDYKLRKFRVSCNDSPPRDITQYHFMAWPDHGVPREPSAVLDFLLKVNEHKAKINDRAPTIVHCSAGIGRTGTFIVIDILLKFIDLKGIDTEIDIQTTIQEIRKQRSGMIQTEEQYRFVYQAIAAYIDVVQQRGAALGSGMDQDLYANLSMGPGGPAPTVPSRAGKGRKF